ncbi:hypothetical protein MOQ_007646, partial [Trypanosoma cruzi marinkellei]
MRCSHGPSHKHRRHRTTARRGHTPAAHDQSSSSPSLLSLTCSLQHKPTPRQRRAKEETSHTTTCTVPSSNESHAPPQQQLGGRRSTTIKTKRSAPRHCTVPHTPTVTITVILSPQALTGTPRSLQHTPLQHRPRDRRVLPAHAVRHALPPSPQRLPPPPSAKQLRVLHVPHNRRHATAAQHPQRHNIVPPLLPNHGRNAQRILAHVLHALQPHTDQAGRHALHLFVVLLLLGADPPHPLNPRHGNCERLPKGATCMEDANVRKQRPPSLPHTSPLPPLSHRRGHTQKHRHPRRTARYSHVHS